jgi:small ligand-binding sensory domain FIST
MRIGSSLVHGDDLENRDAGLSKLIDRALSALDGADAHLGVLTITDDFAEHAEPIAERIRDATDVQVLIGASGEGVVGDGVEVERRSGMALWLAELPDVRVRGFHVHPTDLQALDSVNELRRILRMGDEEDVSLLMLADPFFTPYVMRLLEVLGEVLTGRPVLGGMASGVTGPEQAALVLNDDVFKEGLVGAVLSGNIEVDPVVSQGCRPVGQPLIVTAADNNVVQMLGGRSALTVLNEMFAAASQRDQQLMSRHLFIGRAVSEYVDEFKSGDFLIRSVAGADKDTLSLTVDFAARVGTTVQFHVRDPESADEELRRLLSHATQPVGGLMFSCNGRGTRLYPDNDHDIGIVRNVLGDLPFTGMFCAGEIGPIGGESFIHGQTASLALFRPKA